jgi:hypothetical protein
MSWSGDSGDRVFTVQNPNRRELLTSDEAKIYLFGPPQEYLRKSKVFQTLAFWVVVLLASILAIYQPDRHCSMLGTFEAPVKLGT